MNVYDQAHGLAQAIKESEEFKQYSRLKSSIDANEELSKMVKDFLNLNENEEKKVIQPPMQKALKLTISTFSSPHLERCATVKAATLKVVFVRQQSVVQQAANTM